MLWPATNHIKLVTCTNITTCNNQKAVCPVALRCPMAVPTATAPANAIKRLQKYNKKSRCQLHPKHHELKLELKTTTALNLWTILQSADMKVLLSLHACLEQQTLWTTTRHLSNENKNAHNHLQSCPLNHSSPQIITEDLRPEILSPHLVIILVVENMPPSRAT